MTGMVVGCAVLAVLAVLVWPGRGSPVRHRLVSAGPGHPEPAGPATIHDVADALVLLGLALQAGMGQTEALERVARSCAGSAGDHLQAVAAALRWGRDARQAWGYAPAAWRPAALAWEVAERTGAGPARLVIEASWRIREREDRRVEAAGARAGVRLVLPLGLAFLPAFGCTAVVPVVLALAEKVLGP